LESTALLVGQITLISGGLAFVFGVIIAFWRFSITWNDFLRDWKGDSYKDGRTPTPGVIARLEKLENGLYQVRSEVSPNGGQSIKDVVNRIETRLEEGNQKFDSLDSRMTRIEGTIEP
jgi:hypothetical protein